jgi:hypothetical protein
MMLHVTYPLQMLFKNEYLIDKRRLVMQYNIQKELILSCYSIQIVDRRFRKIYIVYIEYYHFKKISSVLDRKMLFKMWWV